MTTELTNQQRLAAIREKCVEANPEIVESITYVDGDPRYEQEHYRPIRLADVLLALDEWHESEADRDWIVIICNGIFATHDGRSTFKSCGCEWNLLQDSLDLQSEETISFLHSLLCS